MPHSVFTSLTNLGRGVLFVEGRSHDPESVTLVEVAIIAIDRPGMSVSFTIDPIGTTTVAANRFGSTWHKEVSKETTHGDLEDGWVIAVVGAETHSSTEFQNPFRWTTFFEIPTAGQTSEPLLRVDAPPVLPEP